MPNIHQVRRVLLKPVPVVVSANWWEPAALYDFDFVNQRGRNVGGAANIAVGSFSTYFTFASGAPRYNGNGLLFDSTVTFDSVRLAGALATLTSGNDVCIMIEVNAASANINKRMLAADNGGAGDMAPDSDPVLGSYNTSAFISCTLGNSKAFSTHRVRCMYRQTVSGRAICAGGGTVASDANKSSVGRSYWIGSLQSSSNWWDGNIRRLQLFDPATVTNGNMTTYTTGETT